jgi:tRNA A-37 threonylcarbamoyl transferase component Bud32
MNSPASSSSSTSTDPAPDPTVAAAVTPLPGAFAKQDFTGRTLGDFRFIRRLGEGGMGQVYLAEQLSLQRRVAIKLLRPDFLNNETFLKRFKGEAKAVAQLTHPNIVQVHAVGEEQGLHFMALEYVEGLNLKDYLNRKGPPEIPIALAVIKQIVAALMKSAELGIVHRDIKPENILVTRKAEVKVTDFGLSRVIGEELNLTQTGTTMGTPLYMSPEQILGEPVDPRSDLYSLGATCYHLLTGQPPFLAETAMGVGMRHLADPPKPINELRPDVPPDLAKLVHHLLAKKPADRPQSAREVWREVKRIQENLSGGGGDETNDNPFDFGAPPTLVGIPKAETLTTGKRRRHWVWPVVLASLAVAVIGGSLIGFLLRTGTPTLGKPTGSAIQPTVPVPTASAPAKVRPRPNKPAKRNPLNEALEQELLKAIDNSRNPERRADPDFIEGFRVRAQLMRLYVFDLDDENLAKVRRFAQAEAIKGANEPYRSIGHIGLAAIFAYEEKPKASIEELDKAFLLKENPPRRQLLIRSLMLNRDLQDIVLMTLKQIEQKGELPSECKELKEEVEKIRKEANEKMRPRKPS